MTYQEIAAWMTKCMGGEAAAVAADAEHAYQWWRDTPLALDDEGGGRRAGWIGDCDRRAQAADAAKIARRTALEVSIIAHGGLRAIEGMRHAV